MPSVLQLRRGTTAQNNAFTGAIGELSYDTQIDTIRVHDGSTAGGFAMTSDASTATLTNKTLTSPIINTGTFGTSILPVSADGTTLGSATKEFSDLFLADGGTIQLGNDQDVTITHVADTGILLNGSSKIQFTNAAESIHSDGSKLILTSNSVAFSLPTADGSAGQAMVTDASGNLSFAAAGATISADTSTNTDFLLYFAATTSGALTAVKQDSGLIYNPSTGLLTSAAFAGALTGDVTGTASVATAITAADESSDTSCNVLFVTAATGDLPPKSGTNLTFNSSSGVLTATGFAGALTGNVTGTADVATVATTVTITDNESTNENNPVVFVAGGDLDGGNLGLESDGTCTYNPSTGKITATGFIGTLTGTASAAQYSDVAERFASDSVYAPGTVVALGGAEEITQVNEEASDEVFGVISGEHQAAFKMNAGAGSDDSHPFVAMTGRVDVKVIGTVNKGDRLVSASVPGYAKVAQKSECTAFNVIGRALTSKTTAGQGSVLAAVRVSH
jgi:hypothetical protein